MVMFFLCKSIGRFKRKNLYDFFKYLPQSCRLTSTQKSDAPPWNIIFYGTDTISEVTLKALNINRLSCVDNRIVQSLEVICVESDCLVRRYATSNNLTIHTWPFDIPKHTYDVGIVVSFGHMIPSSSILACKYGIINAHPSLLPRWRGAAPIFHTILKGDEKTGVTITQVSPNKFDVGHILMQQTYTVPERCTAKMLMKDLSILAAEMVLKTLQNLPHFLETSWPQPTEGKTLARKIKPEHCYINWVNDSSATIDRKFRALDGFFEVITLWKDSLKIIIVEMASPQEIQEAKVSDLVKDPVNPGFSYFHKKRKIIFVKCKDGWSGIKSVKIPKRGKISALDFYNGFMTKEENSKNCYFT